MWIKEEVTDIQLGERLWSGAVDTWNTICEAGKEEQAMQYFEDLFGEEGAIDITTINDILWMDSDDLMEYLGLNRESKEYVIDEEELQQLKDNGVLSEAHIQVIEDNFFNILATVTIQDLEDAEYLTSEEEEELDKVVS